MHVPLCAHAVKAELKECKQAHEAAFDSLPDRLDSVVNELFTARQQQCLNFFVENSSCFFDDSCSPTFDITEMVQKGRKWGWNYKTSELLSIFLSDLAGTYLAQ